MGDTIKVYSSNYDAKKLIMINPLYDNVEEYTDPSTNIVYPADVSRNYVNFTGDISNNDRLTLELSHYNENTLQDYIAGAKKNYLDLSLNHDLHSLLLWGQYKLDKYPTAEYERDLELPVITLLGDTEISLFVNDNYVEPGYSALDNIDGVITNKVVVTGSVNTSLEGIYDISYDVTDNLGNQAITVVRKVTVGPRFTPVYTNITGVTNEHISIQRSGNYETWNGWNPAENWSWSFKIIKENKLTNNYIGYKTPGNDGAFMQWGENSNNTKSVKLFWYNDSNNRIIVNVPDAYGDYNITSANPRYVQVLITYSNSNYTQNGGGTNPDFGQDLKWYARYADSENNLNNTTWTDVTTYNYTIDEDGLNENTPITWASNNPELWLGSRDAQGGFKTSNPGSIYDFKMWNDTLTTDDL